MKLAAVVVSFLLVGCAANNDSVDNPAASELVLINGSVKTPSGWAEAVAIRDGLILQAGDTEDIQKTADASTQIVDLNGHVVLPGFNDTHVHPLFGGMTYSGADLRTCEIKQGSTSEQLLEQLALCVARVSPDEWIIGGQWDASTLGVTPTANLLDQVSANNPVILNDTSGHSALANTKALNVAGIDRDTPNPTGGIIERDVDGRPTGVLRETAIGLVRSLVPPPSDEVIRRALTWSLQEMLSHGITSYTEASLGFVAGSEREANLYTTLADEGVLKHRVRVCMNWVADNWMPGDTGNGGVIASRKEYSRDTLSFDCVKIFLDGVPTDSHTAAMLSPYEGTMDLRDDEASQYGLLLVDQEKANRVVTEFDAAGLTVKFHAAGDRAVRSGLDAIEAARLANGMNQLRHDLAHCTFIDPTDLGRAEALNATFEMSPYLWTPTPIGDDIRAAVGAQRIERVWPVKDAIDANALVTAGSDWSVVPSVNPWIAVETLVTREQPGGSERKYGPAQRITISQALDLFTINAAQHLGQADRLGDISPGKYADLIVIDQNPYTVPVYEIHKTRVLKTFIGGKMVFEAP